MTNVNPIFNPPITVDSPDAYVELTAYLDGIQNPPTRIVLGPRQAADLLTSLASHTADAAARAMSHLAAGPCQTCGGIGMVDTRKHNQTWMEHCPDCGSRRHRAGVDAAIRAAAADVNDMTHRANGGAS